MLKFLPLLALPLVPLLPLETSAAKPEKTIRADIECKLKTTRGRGSVQLQAIAVARKGVTGEYRFDVEKIGRAGTSQTSQSGEFSLGAGKEAVLGEVEIGIADDASYEATLTLTANGREASCSEIFPDKA